METGIKIYEKKEMVFDCVRGRHNVIVFEINMFASVAADKVLNRIRVEFPGFFKRFIKDRLNNKVKPGDTIIHCENGFLMCAIVNKVSPLHEEDRETLWFLTSNALDKMIKIYGRDMNYYSGPLLRYTATKLHNFIISRKLKWKVYTE